MKRSTVFILTFVGFIVLLLIAVISYNVLSKQYNPKTNTSITSSKMKVSNFTVKDSSGKDVQLSEFIGKPIVMNFWASWCPPCRGEMPDFNKLYNEYHSKGVVFLMINLTDGQRETIDIAKEFIKDNNYKFDVYFDTNSDAADAYNISSIPDSYFIDKNGNIVNSYVGAIDENTICTNIEAILK